MFTLPHSLLTETLFETNLVFIQVTPVCVTVFVLACRNPCSLHSISETSFFTLHTETHPHIGSCTKDPLLVCWGEAECVVVMCVNREPMELISTTSLWCRERGERDTETQSGNIIGSPPSRSQSGAAVPPMRQKISCTQRERLQWWSRDKNSTWVCTKNIKLVPFGA